MPDWVTITAWATGIASVIGAVIGTMWVAITRAMRVAASLPAPVTVTKTDVITTDGQAIARLEQKLDQHQQAMEANTMMLAELVTVGRDLTAQFRADRQEVEYEDEVQRRLTDALEQEREKQRAKRRRAAARKRTLGTN